MRGGKDARDARYSRREFLRMGGAGLAGAAMLGSTACARGTTGPVELTFWSWVPAIDKEVQLFNMTHPDIEVKHVNAGQGDPQYTKLRTAIESGSGAPDVVQITFEYLNTFKQIDATLDLSEHGANEVKGDFVPWTWEQVSEGSAVYAIPQDSGPMGILYRKDIFEEYDLKLPKTWDEFAQEAVKLHKANPNLYLTDFLISEGNWFTGLLAQAGARPFKVDGNRLSISINEPAAIKVAEYWQDLIEPGVIDTAPAFTSEWYTALDTGKYASWITAAWGPTFLSGFAKKSSGKWRAALLPQWNPGEQVSANYGGSTSVVTTQSKYPEEATEFAIWLNQDRKSATMLAEESFLFPVLKSVLNSDSFKNKTWPFYGGQEVNQTFIESAEHVDADFQWSPFQDYLNTHWTNELGAAAKGEITLMQALDNMQDKVTNYAKSQGFKVEG